VTLTDAIEWYRYNIKRRYETVEMIMKLFGAGTETEKEDNKFCAACKAAKKNVNCDTCNRKITVVKK
jgi:hypothetical protein